MIGQIGPTENIYLFKQDALHIVIIQYLLSQKQISLLQKKKEIILQELANNWVWAIFKMECPWACVAREAMPKAWLEVDTHCIPVTAAPAYSAHDTEQQ